ncbi:unnamed protein product [Didymodactylos carnosus]|uniref:Uncharacterized protein n=1 Tax=Didymodactylos carnosus TaxID=1234261 RepID=A0A815NH39_9BILA|nr:unnamed protein product [Didymodactylos carnosus]CAF1493513.1 unnamed protein product [Didymodactylos carnosus]CAF4282550.1 unnamed protein product [Didymodactylos carnosus]CAF4310412.1 unnamed protein product [Didymodactylos carnosus]
MLYSTSSTIEALLPIPLLIGIAVLCLSLAAFCILLTCFAVIVSRSYPISSDTSIVSTQCLTILRRASQKLRADSTTTSKPSLDQTTKVSDQRSTSNDDVDQFSCDKEIQCPTVDAFSTDSLTFTAPLQVPPQSTVTSEHKIDFEREEDITLKQLQSSQDSLTEFFLNNSSWNKITPPKMSSLPCIKLRKSDDSVELSKITVIEAPQSLPNIPKRSTVKDVTKMNGDENHITPTTTTIAVPQTDIQTRQTRKHRTLPTFSVNSFDSLFSKDSLAE